MPATGMLRYGSQEVDSLLFNKCVENSEFFYDFRTWIANTAQPAGGVVIEEDKITITKFLPNTWFIKSNYQLSTQADFLEKFYNIEWILSGVTENVAKFSAVTDYGTYKPWGLVISPISANNNFLCIDDPASMVIYDGKFKNPNYGFAQYGYVVNGTIKLYNYPTYNSSYPEVCLGLFTSVAPDDGDYVTLSTPLVIRMEDVGIIDPSSVEGYRASMGSTLIYDKPMTFQNVLLAHDLAFEETGTYVEPIQGHYDTICPNGSVHRAYVISGRGYSSVYDHLRMPEITNFSTLIQQGFPFKFWAQLERAEGHTCIWDSLATAFNNTTITDPNFLEHLFSKSTGDISTLNLTVDVGLDAEGNDSITVDMSSIFDYSSFASTVNFTFTTGYVKSLHNAFRQTRRLTSVTFNKVLSITEWHGAFEGTTMADFPTNLAPANMWPDDASLSQPTCNLNYAADGSALTWFGNYENPSGQTPEDKCYVAMVNPGCFGAFRSNSLTEIRYLLDMRFVAPIAWNIIDDGPDSIYNNAVFYAPNLTTVYIKNLNKGDWSLDGVKRVNHKGETLYAGNFTNVSADCINYMLLNLTDLRLNATDLSHYETEFNSLNGWAATKGTRRPIVFATTEDGGKISKTLSASGTMAVTLTLSNCTLSLTNGGSTTTIQPNTTSINLASGAATLTFNKSNSALPMKGVIELSDPFKSELTSGLSAANIYLPANASSKISAAALTEANSRGWTVYVGGSVYNG